MKILLLKTWLTNIGNGFIDQGAKTCIKKIFPNSEIIESSGYPNYIIFKLFQEFRNKKYMAGLKLDPMTSIGGINLLFSFKKPYSKNTSVINVGEMVDADLVVFAGCILDFNILKLYENTLLNLKKKGLPIVFLGVGGASYDQRTVEDITKMLKKINPIAFLTRDKDAYNAYSKIFLNSYDGIDCGFFLNDWYTPPKSSESFIAATFDRANKPKIESERMIVRLTHTPFFYPFEIDSEKIDFNNSNLFFSDDIKDYLFFYKNAEEVHTDRIHACVASICYNTKFRLYYKTVRSGILEKLTNDKNYDHFIIVNQEKLKKEKQNLLDALKTMIEKIY